MPLLEIEQKFSFTLSALPSFLMKANFSPFFNTQTFHDTYYDSHNKLSNAGLWLRKRRHVIPSSPFTKMSDENRQPFRATYDDWLSRRRDVLFSPLKSQTVTKEEWEAKQSKQGSSFQRSTFSETTDRNQIAELVRSHFPHRDSGHGGRGLCDAFGLDPIAAFKTQRLTLRALNDDGAAGGNDGRFTVVLDFTDFGHEVGEIEVMAEDAGKAHKEIDELIGKYPWFFDTEKPKGKLTAYFEKFGYPKSEA